MRNHLIKSFLVLACLALISVPLPVNAQSSDLGLSIGTGSSTAQRGSGVAVFGLVTNNTSSRMRATVSISTVSPCGTETSLGEVKLSLEAGKSIALSVYYPIPADACTGTYAVTISGSSGKGGKNAVEATPSSATAYVEVQ
ncbi:MAG: hypothetical protein ACREBC_03545 [Pyrinomonadaceae bacterium]